VEKTKLPEMRTDVCLRCRFGDQVNPQAMVCRLRPPLVAAALMMANVPGTKQAQPMWQTHMGWPVVNPASDWCGEFKPKMDS
jgi:hypothetical protein